MTAWSVIQFSTSPPPSTCGTPRPVGYRWPLYSRAALAGDTPRCTVCTGGRLGACLTTALTGESAPIECTPGSMFKSTPCWPSFSGRSVMTTEWNLAGDSGTFLTGVPGLLWIPESKTKGSSSVLQSSYFHLIETNRSGNFPLVGVASTWQTFTPGKSLFSSCRASSEPAWAS